MSGRAKNDGKGTYARVPNVETMDDTQLIDMRPEARDSATVLQRYLKKHVQCLATYTEDLIENYNRVLQANLCNNQVSIYSKRWASFLKKVTLKNISLKTGKIKPSSFSASKSL